MIDLGLLAERIKNARINKDLSLEDVAEITGLSARTLRRYEAEGLKDLITLDMLCNLYNISITDVIGGRNDLAYLASAINRLGPNACDVLMALCKQFNS